jgi:hypothetical protein
MVRSAGTSSWCRKLMDEHPSREWNIIDPFVLRRALVQAPQ